MFMYLLSVSWVLICNVHKLLICVEKNQFHDLFRNKPGSVITKCSFISGCYDLIILVQLQAEGRKLQTGEVIHHARVPAQVSHLVW